MRLIIIVLGIGIALYYGVSRFFDKPLTPQKTVTAKVVEESQKPLSPSPPGITAPVSAPGATPVHAVGLPVTNIPAPEPMVFANYRFVHREPPDQTFFSPWTSQQVTVSIEPVSGEVMLRGPEKIVTNLVAWCQRFDIMPNSCSVHAWTVYVDRSVQKGFDLLAAIKTVSGAVTEAEIGSGGISLNLGFEDVQAALVVIADGTVVEVVQNPFVRLVDGVEARIESIQELPLPESVVSEGVSQTSVKFRKVGLQLGIKPTFRGWDRVSLDVAQTNGVVGSPVTIDGNQIPVVESQTVSSRVDLNVGEAVVLGGVRTFRNRRVKGILRDTVERSEGALYVVIATHNEIPKAIVVDSIDPPLFGDPWVVPVPGGDRAQDPSEWIDHALLPPPDWKERGPLPVLTK